MRAGDLIRSARSSLTRTKARAVLTMLGIVIGIGSVILTVSIGEAAERYILLQISAFGSDMMILASGPETQSGQQSVFIKETLTYKDIRALRNQPWIKQLSGELMQNDRLTANGLDMNIGVIGAMPDELPLAGLEMGTGSFLENAHVKGRDRIAVLGFNVADKAFGLDDPLGKTVKISGQAFKVIGVTKKAGTKAFTDLDKQVYIPLTSALDLYNKQYVTYASLKTTLPLGDAKQRLREIVRDRHNIENPANDLTKDDFHVMTQEDMVRLAGQITLILKILLIAVAAISLLVGGIGIMNITYVAVTERIGEIGLRKALGATRRDILRQFLAESLMQTMVGGMIGVVMGISLSWLAVEVISRFQEGWTFGVSPTGIGWGLSVSAAIGVVFGYFPARRAARLHPIEALRKD